MTSSVDTAELPRVLPVTDGSPPALVVEPLPPAAPAPAVALAAVEPTVAMGRCEVQAERKAARRQRRRYAALGVGVLAGSLAATVTVLDVIR